MSDRSVDRSLGFARLAMRLGFCCAFTAVVVAATLAAFLFMAG
jgi:hypothetical protein